MTGLAANEILFWPATSFSFPCAKIEFSELKTSEKCKLNLFSLVCVCQPDTSETYMRSSIKQHPKNVWRRRLRTHALWVCEMIGFKRDDKIRGKQNMARGAVLHYEKKTQRKRPSSVIPSKQIKLRWWVVMTTVFPFLAHSQLRKKKRGMVNCCAFILTAKVNQVNYKQFY